MKEAKAEAEKIVAAFKAEQEAAYQEALSKVSNFPIFTLTLINFYLSFPSISL